MHDLAKMYLDGLGVPNDDGKAAEYFEKALRAFLDKLPNEKNPAYIVVGCKNRRLTIITNFLRRVWYRLRKLRNGFRRKKNKKYIPKPIQKGTTTAMVNAIIKKYRPDLLTAAKDKSDDKTSGGNLKATRANKDVPFEQASHPAENKELKQPASKKKSDKKDDSKSGNGNKRVIEQQKAQKPQTRPMQPRVYRNGGERK